MTALDNRVGAAPVLTVTLNPALDIALSVEQLVPDRKLRADRNLREAGRGEVNVSRVLHRLDVPCVSLVVAGGAAGAELIARMHTEGLEVVDVRIDSGTRESIAVTESATARQYASFVGFPVPRAPGTASRVTSDAQDRR